MGETKENYYDLLDKIDSMGNIKDIVRNDYYINQIVTYEGDRHLLCAFADRVNDAILSGHLTDADLGYLRTGVLGEMIANLDKYCIRDLYPYEKGDKLNYISLFNDSEILASSYSNKDFISKYLENPKGEYGYCFSSGSIDQTPAEVKFRIAETLLSMGEKDMALELITKGNKQISEYRKNSVIVNYSEELEGSMRM